MNVKCQNCNWANDVDKAHDLIGRLGERVLPGEIMPYGECPECGAVCHPTEVYTITGLTPHEAATILAALDHYCVSGMGNPANRPLRLHEIACGETLRTGEAISLNAEGIRNLSDRLQRRWG